MQKSIILDLIRKLSYEKKEVTLSSGKKSDFYIDMKQTLLHPVGAEWMGLAIIEYLKSFDGKIKGVGGITMGADPIVTATSVLSLHKLKSPLFAFYIRKEPKGHGTSQWIEGLKNFKSGDAVYILEDVVTTGGSSLKAVERARLAGLDVKGIITCVDREEGGREIIEGQGIAFHSLLTKAEIIG